MGDCLLFPTVRHCGIVCHIIASNVCPCLNIWPYVVQEFAIDTGRITGDAGTAFEHIFEHIVCR